MNVDKPRIIIVGKLPPPYFGPAIATEIILNSSLHEHFEVHHFNSKLNESQSDIGRWSLRKMFASFRQYMDLRRMLKDVRPDLILIPISQSTIGFIKDALLILIASFARTRILLHLRGSNFLTWYRSANPLVRSFVRLSFARSHGVIVLGQKLRYLFEPFFPAESIYVVPNGADFELPSPSGRDSDKVRLFFLANFRRSKGIADVISALAEVEQECQGEYSFSALGNWAEPDVREEVMGRIAEKGLPVDFIPSDRSKEKMQFLADADVFIFPPRAPEGHPWVIVEAMASGLPIISTDQGAITESVEDGRNGFIVDPAQPAQIAARITELIRDPELRQRMGRESRRIYEERFTERAMVMNLKQAIDRTIAQPRIK